MTPDIKIIVQQLEQGIANIAETSLKNYVAQAKADGQTFLTAMENDLTNWTNLLAAGQLTPNDFKDLVLGQKDVLKMAALKQAGIAQVQLDQFKEAVFGLVINTIMSAVKKI